MSRTTNNIRGNQSPIVLNVAEKPSVARALSLVFSQMPGSISCPVPSQYNGRGKFLSKFENVTFPSVFLQQPPTTPNGNNMVVIE